MSYFFAVGNKSFLRHRAAVTTTAMLMLAGAAGAVGYGVYSAGNWAVSKLSQKSKNDA